MYKDIFFTNYTMKEYLMEAVINVYIDSERTDYYGKFSFRHAAAMIMEYVWGQDKDYRDKFESLGQAKPGLFVEFCNFLINDVNNLLFEGILCLEEIRNFEELSQSPDFSSLDQE